MTPDIEKAIRAVLLDTLAATKVDEVIDAVRDRIDSGEDVAWTGTVDPELEAMARRVLGK